MFATDLHAGLSELGLRVETVALAPGDVGGLDVPTLGKRRRLPGTLRALRRRARDADVVVAHGSTTLPATALATLGLSRPFVYRQISDSLFWAPTRGRRARVRMALRRAACVVALWDGAARVLVERFGVPPANIHVVPNGVACADWRQPAAGEREWARRRLELPLDRPVITFVGALVPEKGPDLAIETVSATKDTHLLVVGGGLEEVRIKTLAAQLLGRRVTFVGNSRNMWDVYAATDVLLFPSRGGDSMPAVVIEAAFMGVPTVATDIGALAQMIDPGVTGEIVAAPDVRLLAAAIRSLSRQPTRRRAMGQAAREFFLKKFDLSEVSRQWYEVLQGVVNSRARSEPAVLTEARRIPPALAADSSGRARRHE